MAAVLFVCLANICRSPAAEGTLRYLAAQDGEFKDLRIESCGIGGWSVGQSPDERIRQAAEKRGILLSGVAKKFQLSFLDEFEYILAADHEILHELYHIAKKPEHKAKIHLITHFSKTYENEEISDPFYYGEAAFEQVLDMLEDSCHGLLQHMRISNASPS
jgi:protein-tyrosine phosphatase